MRHSGISAALAWLLVCGPSSWGSAQDSKAGGAGPMCIGPEAVQEVQACPAGGAMFGKSKLSTNAPRAVDRQRDQPKEIKAGPSIQIDAATLRNKAELKLRAEKLLEKEVAVLERLIRNTPTDSPKRPDILLRLAETYFELQQQATAKVRSYDEPIFAARKKNDKGQVKRLTAEQKQAEARLNEHRKDAISAYARLVKDHSDFKRMDEVLFALGFALDEMRQSDKARTVYYRLIKEYPQSRFVPNAWLSFAEHFFAEGDMAGASKMYAKVTEFPPERNAVYGYALYKRAWCLYNIDDFKGSLRQFVEVLEYAKSHPDARDTENLAKQSRRELIMPYARVGSPGKALDFFRRYAVNSEQAYEMLEALAELYYDTGTWDSAAQVYHELMGEMPKSDRLCYWQGRVTSCVLARDNKKDGVREAERLVDVWESYRDGNRPADAKKECQQATATVLVDLATSWHREAVGNENQPGTNDRHTMELSARLYRLLLEKFPDMAQMEFPDIDKRDWPTQYRVSYYYAELLWKMERWAECAPAFDRVVDLDPKGELTEDAALAAVLCYNNLYQQQFAASERETMRRPSGARRAKKSKEPAQDYQRRELTALEVGMLAAFQRYVCFVPKSEDLPTMKYRRARIYYEANRFEEAAVIFRDVAYNHKDSDLAEYAANLYLDSLNVLASMREGDKRPKCYDEMSEAVPKLFALYCSTPDDKAEHEGLCKPIEQLRCDIERKRAETYEARKEHREAAYAYVDIFRKAPECGKLDEVLYNAALNFEAAKLIGRAIKVRTVLIERYPDSALAKRAVYLVGANYQALALYSKAAEYYESFATRFPGEDGKKCTDAEIAAKACPKAQEALQDATFFRLGLGEDDKAVADAKLFEKNYRRRYPRETSQVIFSLASIYEGRHDWKGLIGHYKDYLKKYKRQALPHEELRANVAIGVALWKLNDRRQAESYFKTAVRLWGPRAETEIARVAGDDKEKAQRWTAEANQAAAEAQWHLAEVLFNEFDKIKFPELTGAANLERVNAWAKGPFVRWIEKKGKALSSAEKAYGKVREYKAPMWDIAAAERVGVMYRSFVDEFRDAPVPNQIRRDPELMDIYLGSLDEKSQPWVVKATGAFEFCLNLATQVRWFNEFSRQCEHELNRLDARKYPLAAELRGEPNYAQRTQASPVAARIGGSEEEE